jgi:3-methyladenine DNA glycosylase/8-oxoguanine DNA glycosylase
MTADVPLPVTSPFDLAATVRLLQRRPANRIDRWQDGRYMRAFTTTVGMRLVVVYDNGSIDDPDLRMQVLAGPAPADVVADLTRTVRRMLGLDASPPPAERLVDWDPRLAPILERLRGFRPPCFPDLFTTCLGVLPFQQLSLDAGLAILGRLVGRLGPRLDHAGGIWYDYPSPRTVATGQTDDLVAVGLSRAKAVALLALAEAALAGELDSVKLQSLSTDDAMRQLQLLPGIGPWSAGLIMLRALRRMDVFPAGDSGAARSLTALLGIPAKLTSAEADRIAEQIGDHRGYLYYLCLGSRQA